MEDKKYYTPKENELFIGYECEILKHSCWRTNLPPNHVLDYICEERWIPFIVENISKDNNDLLKIRTSYLSKEDIESEEWKFRNYCEKWEYWDFSKKIEGLTKNDSGWEKGDTFYAYDHHSLIYYPKTHILMIAIEPDSFFSYNGECKSINEFRTLQKWLGIKK